MPWVKKNFEHHHALLFNKKKFLPLPPHGEIAQLVRAQDS